MPEHIHRPIYGNAIFTSYPPLIPWICMDCGTEGTVIGGALMLSYDEVKRRFAAQRCAAPDCDQPRQFGDLCGYHHAVRQIAEQHAEANLAGGVPDGHVASMCQARPCDEPPTCVLRLEGAWLALCAGHYDALGRTKLARRVETADMDRLVRVARQLWAPLFERGEDVAERWRTIIHAVLAALTDDAEVEA